VPIYHNLPKEVEEDAAVENLVFGGDVFWYGGVF
jgi:hypothetical protein